MKIVLVITSDKSKDGTLSADRLSYIEDFCAAVEDSAEDVRVLFTTYPHIEMTIVDGEMTAYDHRNKITFNDVVMVHFKNWVNDTEIAGSIARFCKAKGIAFYNSEVGQLPARGKLPQMIAFASNNLPVPNTFYAHRTVYADYCDKQQLPEGFKFPIILKDDLGAKGNNNYLVEDFAQMTRIIADGEEVQYVVQEYLSNDGDYRVLFIGIDEEPMVFLRRAGDESGHLNNTSQGGSGSMVGLDKLPKEYLQLAHRAAEVTNREIAGVDILVDKTTNKPYLLEVNQTPALATGYNIPLKASKFAALIKEHLDSEDE